MVRCEGGVICGPREDRGCSRMLSRWAATESLVPRRSALRAGTFVDRGFFDLFADAVKGRQRSWESGAMTLCFGSSVVCEPGLFRPVRRCCPMEAAQLRVWCHDVMLWGRCRLWTGIVSTCSRMPSNGGAMLVRVWCHNALGAVSVVDQG